MVLSRPEVGVSSRESAWTLSSPPSWSVARFLVLGWASAGLLQEARPPLPVVPLRPPCIVGPTREGKVKEAGRACGELGDSSSSLQKTSTLWGTWLSPECVCARACVYLLSNLSIYIYVCGNVGAKEVEGRGGHSSGPPFSAPGPGLPSTSRVGV